MSSKELLLNVILYDDELNTTQVWIQNQAARIKGAEITKHAIPVATSKANFRMTNLIFFDDRFYIALVIH